MSLVSSPAAPAVLALSAWRTLAGSIDFISGFALVLFDQAGRARGIERLLAARGPAWCRVRRRRQARRVSSLCGIRREHSRQDAFMERTIRNRFGQTPRTIAYRGRDRQKARRRIDLLPSGQLGFMPRPVKTDGRLQDDRADPYQACAKIQSFVGPAQ